MATTEKRAKLFQTGRSQAVRLPKEFRFIGKEVRIRKVGTGIVLEPIGKNWDWLHELRGLGLDEDVVAAAEQEVPQQERPKLARLFR